MPTRLRTLVFAAAALLAASTLAFAPAARAQQREVTVTPTGQIDQPLTFLPANGIHVTLPAATLNATATGTTNVFTIPVGALQPAVFVGGLPQTQPPAILHFYATSVSFEYVTLTGATAAATVNVGSTATSASSIISGASLPYTGVSTGSLVATLPVATGTLKPLATGDVITVTVGTAFAGATAATLKVHVGGYYQ